MIGLRQLVLLTAFLVLLQPATGSAFCFREAAELYGVPAELLIAIARVESGMDPNALNVNKDGSVDVGLMQVNSAWKSRLGPGWEAIEDPCFNVMVGAWILRQCIDRYGISWDAVSCYHTGRPYSRLSGTIKRLTWRYLRRVAVELQRLQPVSVP